MWPIILGPGLYKTCRGVRVLVVIRFNANILTFEPLLQNNMYLFLERCRKPNNIWLHAFHVVRLFIFVLIL